MRLWRGDHYAYDGGDGPSSDSIMADQLAGQWYADATGLGDLLPARPRRDRPADHPRHERAWPSRAAGWARSTGCGRTGPSTTSSEQSAEVWVGTTYALAAFMIGRGLTDEGWETARGVAVGHLRARPVVPDPRGVRRAPATSGRRLYLRPLAIWAIEEALERRVRATP